jgi:hypothetical protein
LVVLSLVSARPCGADRCFTLLKPLTGKQPHPGLVVVPVFLATAGSSSTVTSGSMSGAQWAKVGRHEALPSATLSVALVVAVGGRRAVVINIGGGSSKQREGAPNHTSKKLGLH